MKDQIKVAIMELLKVNPNYTFSELITAMESSGFEVKGTRALYIKKNLLLWEATSAEFNNAILELQQADHIILEPLSAIKARLLYSYQGEFPDLPIANVAESIKEYSTPHWIPTLIKPNL